MPRAKTEATVKVKNAILELSDNDQDLIQEWLEMFVEVRDQERERRARKEQP